MSDLVLKIAPDTFDQTEAQKLHGATFDGDIESLLDQIGQGLRADDATNFEKLTIARKYGLLLLQLKGIVPHGQFKQVLKERFPRVSYSKCNRWMVIARHETQVAEVLVAYPDVVWGPKKMIDFLTKEWRPEIDCDDDEEECWGLASDETNDATLAPEVTDDDPELETTDEEVADGDDDRSKWESLAETAESEARLMGSAPVVPTNEGTVTVTVFTEDDHDVIEDALIEWRPKTVPVLGRNTVTNLTVTVSPEAIPEVLTKLGKTLRKAMPTQLKVNIEL